MSSSCVILLGKTSILILVVISLLPGGVALNCFQKKPTYDPTIYYKWDEKEERAMETDVILDYSEYMRRSLYIQGCYFFKVEGSALLATSFKQ